MNALMQRSGSAKRSRRRALGLTAAVAVHLLAAAAILPVARMTIADAPYAVGGEAPLIIVGLVHLRPEQGAGRPQPESAPKSKSTSLPDKPSPVDLALNDPQPAGPVTTAPPEDDEPLYRAPFRDAVGQAVARLRAGLDCAHVALDELPQPELDLCLAAARSRGARPPRGPLG
jgi:hypothetical protein